MDLEKEHCPKCGAVIDERYDCCEVFDDDHELGYADWDMYWKDDIEDASEGE